MPSSQHDGASDEGEKRNGNGSQDRWHQRAGSGARGRRGSGSLLRHDCAAHCSHHHNGDKGGAPHCCQSRSHCAADDEGSTQTNKKRRTCLLCFAFLQTCLFRRCGAPRRTCFAWSIGYCCKNKNKKKDREAGSERRSGEDARRRGFVQWETVKVHHALFVHSGQLRNVSPPCPLRPSETPSPPPLSLRPPARPPR